jgi:uncharacterized membrane protein YdbT with pleckstrin-like domain
MSVDDGGDLAMSADARGDRTTTADDRGDRVLWRGTPSWKSMLVYHVKWTVLALIPVAIWIAIDAGGQDVPEWPFVLATLAILVVSFVVGWVRRATTRYILTDRTIEIRTGLISRDHRRTHVDRVQNLGIKQSVVQRLLGIGDVEWDTAGTDRSDADFTFRGVDDPADVIARAEPLTGGRREM